MRSFKTLLPFSQIIESYGLYTCSEFYLIMKAHYEKKFVTKKIVGNLTKISKRKY